MQAKEHTQRHIGMQACKSQSIINESSGNNILLIQSDSNLNENKLVSPRH